MNDASISNEIILNAVTVSKLDEFGSQLWDAMKEYIVSHEDTSNLMIQIKSKLDQANREVIGTTGTQKADAIKASVAAMVAAFEDAGVDMTNKTTGEFAALIGALTNVSGVYILDENNVQWTAEHWAEERRQGTVMPNYVGILLVLADRELIISADGTALPWGTYNVTIPNLNGYAGGPAGTPKSGLYNTKTLLSCCDPDTALSHGFAITYVDGTTTETEIANAYCVLFADSAAQVAFATKYGISQMNTWGYSKVYAYGSTGNWRTSYWKQNMSSISASSFQQIYAKCPVADSYGNVGSPSAKWCVDYTPYVGDTHDWYEPSVFELFQIYLNYNNVNACLTAMDKPLLGTSYHWSSIQNGSNLAYYVSLSSGEVNASNFKNGSFAVRAFTSR